MAFFRSRQDGRAKRRRLLAYAMLGGSAILMVNALVGEHGYLATIRTQREAEAIQEETDKTLLQNEELKDRIERLKHDPAALEEAARRDLGLIKPGEALIIIHDGKSQEPSSPPPAAVK